LPGPSSSQVGILIGMVRGGIVAWFSFTLPSAVVLITFATYYLHNMNSIELLAKFEF
jgi:chromate transport protein ChrA